EAEVWVNDYLVACHQGGHTPFTADITFALRESGTQTVTVRVEDDPHDLAKPRGKQDWQLEPHSVWYPRTTGIWQTVWLEVVPPARIQQARWTPSLDRWEVGVEARIIGETASELTVDVALRH